MEVVVATRPPSAGGSPFHDHDVREWSRIDSITGALERARLETDSWTASTNDSCHRYGKVVDSRARTGADGSLQAQASRQLEVFQSRTGGSRVQVVKTKTVSSSSSRWSGKAEKESPVKPLGFDNLQLPLNPLDISSQKSKASVGRSVNRRPPTRHARSHNPFSNDIHDHLKNVHFTAAANLHRVSRLCHQIHESAVRNAFGRISTPSSPRGSADGSVSGVEIAEIESNLSNSDLHSNLKRTKSNSSEDIQQIPEKETSVNSELENLDQLQHWRRDSKVRRSLQCPKSNSPTERQSIVDLPENSVNVKKLRDELEKGRRLTTALRNNSFSSDLTALDQIIRSISSASSLERSSTDDNLDDRVEGQQVEYKLKKKRDSFVTVESLKEVRDRLRRTSSPGSDIYTQKLKPDLDSDDGIIVTEDQVKSYIYGMEKMLNNKKSSIIGTGSLESRSKFSNGTCNHKNEDWYNRRKSYGFEKVHGPEESASISLKDKTLVESSTDSGICRSSEIMVVPTATKSNNETNNGRYNSDGSESDIENKINGINYGNVKKMTSIFDQENKNHRYLNWSKRDDWKNNEIKSTTITIPIVKNNNIVDLSWNDEPKILHDLEDDTSNLSKRSKKVEFCKTEVHFAAESGKVNIVETDEKPPPTQNFRRRRRISYPEDFNTSGLPILHFGDEKVLDDQKTPSAFSVVTVNTSRESENQQEEDKRDLQVENDNLKGILKNKPIKPKPYHLGEIISLQNDEEESTKWGVKLRHVPKESPPIWKSTVTVHNNYQSQHEVPEFQKLLKNLKPATTKKPDYMSDNENRYSDSFANIRVVPTVKDNRRSSWSVADKVKLVDETQENKGYSTKVNFGDGEAIVVENDQSTWPRVTNLSKDSKQILNKGLVVRIGRRDSVSKHTVCSKLTTTNEENNTTTTTTKITIDLSRSSPTDKRFTYTKFKRSQNPHSFKSTPLVLNTIKDQRHHWQQQQQQQQLTVNQIPQQIEALRKLYEDTCNDDADSDADKEVQLLLSKASNNEINFESDHSDSILSGSWSRMKAFKNLNETGRNSFKSKRDLINAKDNKDNPVVVDRNTSSYNKYSIHANGSKFSPVVLRKIVPIINSTCIEDSKLTSPLLTRKIDNLINAGEFKNLPDPKLQSKENVVLRQPKQSEMMYFGVDVATKREQKNSKVETSYLRSSPPVNRMNKPRKFDVPNTNLDQRIYENLRPVDNGKYSSKNKDFDSSILEELTKAADQIFQAVNGYTSEDCKNRLSSDEEPRKPLDTISETQSWKNYNQDLELKNQQRMRPTLASAAKMKVKRTSSTSSVESLSKGRRKFNSATSTNIERKGSPSSKSRRKPSTNDTISNVKASTKARRLQRASSREALLQSHGSSSEDLPANIEAPPRKPRLIKKTRAAQLTITNGMEFKKPVVKKSRETSAGGSKCDSRIMGSLPEIRHKTAISTITNIAEKCSRDRSKTRTDESRSKSHNKRENGSKGTVSSSSASRPIASKENVQQQSQRTAPSKESTVTQHRISTANIKRCHRSETSTTKH
ncbi:hypothetical protein ABEB36_010529 [Hypothenemus hampei]|uniref:Uncharacterized protein n=1 Tax=Hypothenemus hampei TaxID=57062 RepID=A0ABD1EKI5_HYPHA